MTPNGLGWKVARNERGPSGAGVFEAHAISDVANRSWRDNVQPWLESVAGRLHGLMHLLVAHRVMWQHQAAGCPCPGDIACLTCDQLLWCRVYDPWRAADAAGTADHWGAVATDRPAQRLESHGDCEAHFLHMLRLVDTLPRGAAEDAVRRGICELIEADKSAQPDRTMTLIRRVAQLQHERRFASAAAGPEDARTIEALLTALSDNIVPSVRQNR